MIAQLDNKVISSFLLFVDHSLQSTGQAFFNTSGLFYQVPSNIANTYCYASTYKSLCNDKSVTGVTVLSGIYLNNVPISIGQSGYQGINHYQGMLYFTGALPAGTEVSGDFGVKEFSVQLTDKPEWKLLFDTKYVSNNSSPSSVTGLDIEVKTSPIVFIKPKIQDSRPFALGGMDNSQIRLRAIIVADNEYQKIAASCVLKNLNYRFLPIALSTPFSPLGTLTGTNFYHYNNLAFDSIYQPMILSVKVIDIPQDGNFKNINRNMAMVDFDISVLIRHW